MEVWQDFGQRIDLAVRCATVLIILGEPLDTLVTPILTLYMFGARLSDWN